MNKRYHYFYKITNNINSHYYYGVHNTDDLDDGYMGSGRRLHLAYEKYGIENFEKEILRFFNTSEEAFNYEAEVVTEELTKDSRCYNIQCGGRSFSPKGLVCVRDRDGNYFSVRKEDPRYINGELVSNWTGKHHTQESRNKIRKTMSKENSTNNRVWVNKEGIVKYLLKTKLDEYLDNGWTLGRTGYKPRKNGQGKKLEE